MNKCAEQLVENLTEIAEKNKDIDTKEYENIFIIFLNC